MTTQPSPIILQAPASKSLSHRVLIAAALAPGKSRLSNVLESEDLERTRDILALASALIQRDEPGRYTVSGMPRGPQGRQSQDDQEPLVMDVGESGTTCRLLTAVLAAGQGAFRIQGRGKMHARPIASLVRALREQGTDVDYLEQQGCPPLLLRAAGLPGGEVSIDLDESSQYLSGLLLAAPLAHAPLTVRIGGSKVVSWPYVGLTLQIMERFGARFQVQSLQDERWTDVPWQAPGNVVPARLRIVVQPGAYQPRDMAVEGDWSNASYFLAAGALSRVPVGLRGLNADSLQGDRAIADILARMGAGVTWKENEVVVAGGRLHGVDLDMGSCPDLVPTVAAVAAQAEGTTTIRNVAHLRIKESDRLDAVVTELTRIGTKATPLEDGMRIEPAPLPAGRRFAFKTYGDHRLAMSLSLLELAGIGVDLDQPSCVAKSFPEFWNRWAELKVGLHAAGQETS
ncbi:3-phosphoshikimate 1-carboxyvinyltransferase [Desulfonatronum thiosulfatophilum]|uniref:3-phosphoshikimate 1-carboxyvinyltransferase n=1 Tax=Desulfonatronum thiosulfatophilum TaxID=617002 RepID=A0A1G6B1G8_9BACT|nr:3-phosphoshikimate 1-carboxyvinyltransferase [Desulfonatronum thiosulfatophilum]SDB14517.1 3-phosphoshikimate 1-carboxyvinyltransferase [Desulfonatronum thiosulfatophilum]